MASNVHLATSARNACLSALATLLNSGFIDIYDGAQPANASVAVSTQNKLVRLTFGATAFGAPSGGSMTANAVTPGAALVDGSPTWARLCQSDGTTAVLDVSAGVASSSPDLVLPGASSAFLPQGTTVSITSLTVTEPA